MTMHAANSHSLLSLSRDQTIGHLRQIYDLHRTALLNDKYYACRLASMKRNNKIFEIVLALGTSTSLSGLTLVKEPPVLYVWSALALLSAVAAIVKPVLQWSNDIERYSKLHMAYLDLYHELNAAVGDIAAQGGLTSHSLRLLDAARERHRSFSRDGDERPASGLHDRCWREVNRQHPAESYWRPPKNAVGTNTVATSDLSRSDGG